MSTLVHMVGALFILLGTISIAYNRIEQYENRYQLLHESERILNLLRQRIVYQKMPLKDIVEELKENAGYQWKKLLWKIDWEGERISAEFPELYGVCIEKTADRMGLSKEEKAFLLGIKQVFLSFDQTEAEMELQMLKEEQKILESKIDHNRKDFKKITMAFGIAGGVMGILLFL